MKCWHFANLSHLTHDLMNCEIHLWSPKNIITSVLIPSGTFRPSIENAFCVSKFSLDRIAFSMVKKYCQPEMV